MDESKSVELAIIDYGMGNLRSVAKAFEHVGATVRVITDAKDLGDAAGLVLPGVGAVGDCMDGLHAGKTDDLVRSPMFGKFRATGLPVKDYQNVIHVNLAGVRFVNEEATGGTWWDACMAPNAKTPPGANGGGPIWAIFDAEAARREKWVCQAPYVDPDGWFFSGGTLEELAARVVCKYQKEPLPADALAATVRRYNGFVDAGQDGDFGKTVPTFKIQTPPFYAAWSTPCAHDCLSGLRINGRGQVTDWSGAVIPGLYCAGESAGGFMQHGLAKSLTFGRIAGREAARSTTRT